VQLEIHGARGSIPVSDTSCLSYGGNTSCFEVDLENGHRVLLDAGSGMARVQDSLASMQGNQFTIFLTHYHWDHIAGLLLFNPLWRSDNDFRFIGPIAAGSDVRRSLSGAIRPPWFPVSLLDSPANVTFEEVEPVTKLDGVTITSRPLNHPQGSMAYRLDGPERSLVLATDHEAGTDADQELTDLATGADVLIHDAEYTPEEYPTKVGWGHSTFEGAVAAAQAASVEHLILTSHDPEHDDHAIDNIVSRARRRFPDTAGAREGMVIPL
jgi:phosphoribosyl 1,2-cyclic phosphodiesterase